jgi:myo-inositol 2-dehydrogenase/D-chiro-inositol 1-dehydrogenase
MTSPRLGVGFIGAGPVTQAIHLPTLARLPNIFEVVAVMDVDSTIADSVARRAGARGVTTADEVMDDTRVDVVAICSPPQFHADQVIAAIAAGKKAILCEKPFAVSRAEAEKIGAMAERSGVSIIVGAMHTFDPAWTAAVAALDLLDATIHTVRSTIILPFNERYEDWATQIHERKTQPPADLAQLAARQSMISAGVLGLAIHDLPHVRKFIPTFESVGSAAILPPFGYAITLRSKDHIAELIGRMDRQWKPDWTFDAIGDDVSLHIDFPPSYVQAGSSVATLRSVEGTRTFGPYDVSGYEAEWLHVADLARGDAEPLQPLQSIVDDLTYAVAIAEGASASLELAGVGSNG